MRKKEFLDNYIVYENGDIYNIFGKQLKTWYDYKNDYEKITLFQNKKRKHYYVHRIIGLLFVENQNNKPCINHKDCDKRNNNFDNLEWVTYSENHKHAYKNGLMKSYMSKKVMLSIDSVDYLWFDSMLSASEILDIGRNTIRRIILNQPTKENYDFELRWF